MMVDRKSMQMCRAISSKHRSRGSGVSRRIIGRFIGTAAIVLLAGSSAFGQFIVQPMKVEAAAPPNRRFPTTLAIENLNNAALEQVDIRLVDIAQGDDGVWQAVEPDNPSVVALERSCIEWLTLEEDSVELAPLERKVSDGTRLPLRPPLGRSISPAGMRPIATCRRIRKHATLPCV